MTPLQQIETEILTLQDRLSLRPTLDLARSIGERLTEAKQLLPHGHWLPWLRRCRIAPRTAQTYMQLQNTPTTAHFSEHLTIEQFLRKIRLAKRQANGEAREEARREARERLGTLPPSIELHHADAGEFRWPTLDMIATDPPWADLDAYRTLGRIGAAHLRPGGLLLAQCGVAGLGSVLAILTEAGLTYRHCLALVYSGANGGSIMKPFQSNWRPILVMSRGKMDRRGIGVVSDVFTTGRHVKGHHQWQQPREPWEFWLSRLTIAGQLCGDPFAGSAEIGLICRGLQLRYLGTEIDKDHYETARGRLVN